MGATTIMMRDLLEGADPSAEIALREYFATRATEQILWYPSAGDDYRDLFELSPVRRQRHQIDLAPSIVCHTDYNPAHVNLVPGVIYEDRNSTVRLRARHSLRLSETAGVRYVVSPRYAVFPDSAKSEPTIYLLDLELESRQLGRLEAQVLYFLFENYNFLEELVLRHRLNVTHFVKVREGCGFGGCRKSISVFYSMLANVGVQYLLVDSEVQYCVETHDRLARRHGLDHKRFTLERLGAPTVWSGFEVRWFRVHPNEESMTKEDLEEISRQIAVGRTRASVDAHPRR